MRGKNWFVIQMYIQNDLDGKTTKDEEDHATWKFRWYCQSTREIQGGPQQQGMTEMAKYSPPRVDD